MRVLFVSSGNAESFDVVPFIVEQGESLKKLGVDLEYYPVRGKGLKGYLRAGIKLRKHVKQNHYDLIHAHFILSGYAALLGSRGTPIVLSLMGSDAYGEYIGANKVQLSSRLLTVLTLLIQPFVHAIISKAPNIEKYVYLKRKSFLVPNGIDMEKFIAGGVNNHGGLNFTPHKKQVLFLGSEKSVRKNIGLVKEALAILNRTDVELIHPYPIAHQEIPQYLNAASVLTVCSYMEGSPNVVKEAMACNCPIVATDVGDIKWVLGNVAGCFLASFQPRDYADKLRQALEYSEQHGRTEGAKRIKALGLDSETIARRVLEIYTSVLSTS